jgi:serine/threonine protein kinase
LSKSSQTSPQRLGKYELREKLGYGGAAEVWKAFDTELERYVAIKLLHADLRTDPEFITRFSREARFIASLHHPNIVQIYDFQMTHSLEANTPVAYMVMDYVEGETLAQYINRTARVGNFPSPTEIVHLFASIARALDYAHAEGMIHRDIKPANILLDKRHAAPNSPGEPVLTDFGIAKIIGANSGTMSGEWLGTPLYISPEQARGYPGTKRSDIYSLGIILYEICTGVCPFRGESVTAILMQQVSTMPTPPAAFNPAIPPALTTVILRAIAKDPAERFSSASALTAAIAAAFHLPLPADIFPSTQLSNLETTYVSPRQPYVSSPLTPQRAGQSQPIPVIHTRTQPSPVSAVKSTPPVPPWRSWKGNLIAWSVVLFVLISSTLVSINLLSSGHASPPATVGTLTFTNSGQYDPNTTVGYNDRISLSLHNLTIPQTGRAYFAWLLPDQGDDATVPILLGRLPVNAGNATLQYDSPAHTNLLAQYSRVRITEQSADNNPITPSPDPKTWRWEGSFPNTPIPGDPHQYSLLSHLRHLLAKDPTLQNNGISGGLVIWMTRNVSKVEEWSSAAQGSWGTQMSNEDADLIHKHMLRILDYLDGQTYVWQDVPAGSPWLVDPQAGKLGLLSRTQGQDPPGYLEHVDMHLAGLADAPGHTDEQRQLAIQVDSVITRMIKDLTTVHKDAVQLVQRNNDQLRQQDSLTLLNEMATLTREVNSGWFDTATHENVGGAVWLSARLQQLATISLTASKQQ